MEKLIENKINTLFEELSSQQEPCEAFIQRAKKLGNSSYTLLSKQYIGQDCLIIVFNPKIKTKE